MGTLRRFEDIEGWQRARELTRAIYQCTRQGAFARDYGLRDQVRRAATSVMSNIAEGFERSGTGEFIQFLAIAKGSVAEIESHLYVALDQAYIAEEEMEELRSLTTPTKSLIAGFMHYLRQSGVKGVKFKKDQGGPSGSTAPNAGPGGYPRARQTNHKRRTPNSYRGRRREPPPRRR